MADILGYHLLDYDGLKVWDAEIKKWVKANCKNTSGSGGNTGGGGSDITKVSELENDAGYITKDSLPTKVSELTNDSGYITNADIPTVPSKTSELVNDSGFVSSNHTHSVNDVTGLSKVASSGSYNDLSDVPDLSNVGTKITKISELENDDYTVKDKDYVHTDNNFTDKDKATITGLTDLKEITTIEFTSDSPYWSGNTLTLTISENQYFIALYRTSSSGAVLDVSTSCKQLDNQVIIEASSPFDGYVLVSGVVDYGSLNELLGIILNEETGYTYTLEDILGEAYKEPQYPNKEELANTVTALNNCVSTLTNKGTEILTECNNVKAECKDYFDLIANRYMELETETNFVKANDFDLYKQSIVDGYYNKEEVDSKVTSVDERLTSEKLKYISMNNTEYGELTSRESDTMYIVKNNANTAGIYINGLTLLGGSGSSGDSGSASSFSVTPLNSNDDLNQYTNTGFFVCAKYVTAQTIKNLPTGFKTAFFMLVMDNGLKLQIIWHYQGKEMYIRSDDFYDDTDHWSSWYKFSGSLVS